MDDLDQGEAEQRLHRSTDAFADGRLLGNVRSKKTKVGVSPLKSSVQLTAQIVLQVSPPSRMPSAVSRVSRNYVKPTKGGN